MSIDALDYVLAHRSLTVNGCEYSLLSCGFNAAVVAISDKMVAKVFSCGDSEADWELSSGKLANSINGLMPKYLGLQSTPGYEFDLVVMERLYPMQARAFSIEERKAMGAEFIRQVDELHNGGFCHMDIKRPVTGAEWDNIILTPDGIRLIDTGCSIDNTHPDFDDECLLDKDHAREFVEWLLKQP